MYKTKKEREKKALRREDDRERSGDLMLDERISAAG